MLPRGPEAKSCHILKLLP
ncbi:rCG35757 [Rattus norvegicus]|uniref:RCG35757 n=1 Tax=Rattus norvegicus TaxID=10116 RepID=A6IJL1_RAT|nr:rCG35757 [Rattus norvegicus]